jgi:hypothetical protein
VSAAALASAALGVAFVFAGGAKLAAGRAWPAQAAALGAPAWTVPLLPWVELVLGALAIVQLGRCVVAVALLALLAAFSALIVLRLREGRRPPCACFGSWSAQPLGWQHLARNAVLAALAVVAIAG